MLKKYASRTKVYLVTGSTDLRLGIDGLAAIVERKLKLSVYSSALFLFCGTRNDRVKGLLWEGDGFLLLHKRLSDGSFRWPRNANEARLLSEREIRWFFDGLEIDKPKAIKPGKKGVIY